MGGGGEQEGWGGGGSHLDLVRPDHHWFITVCP